MAFDRERIAPGRGSEPPQQRDGGRERLAEEEASRDLPVKRPYERVQEAMRRKPWQPNLRTFPDVIQGDDPEC